MQLQLADPAAGGAANHEGLRAYIREKEGQLAQAFNRPGLVAEILLKQGFNLHCRTRPAPEFLKNEVVLAED